MLRPQPFHSLRSHSTKLPTIIGEKTDTNHCSYCTITQGMIDCHVVQPLSYKEWLASSRSYYTMNVHSGSGCGVSRVRKFEQNKKLDKFDDSLLNEHEEYIFKINYIARFHWLVAIEHQHDWNNTNWRLNSNECGNQGSR